jgi:hypothetical protein
MVRALRGGPRLARDVSSTSRWTIARRLSPPSWSASSPTPGHHDRPGSACACRYAGLNEHHAAIPISPPWTRAASSAYLPAATAPAIGWRAASGTTSGTAWAWSSRGSRRCGSLELCRRRGCVWRGCTDAGLVGQGRQPASHSALPPLSRACSITRQLSPRAVD